MTDEITFRPIGFVKNHFDEPAPPDEMRQTDSTLVIEPAFTEGLIGLSAGQRLMVIFYFDRADSEAGMLQHYRGDASQPQRGVFTLRSPHRPNRIGVTVVTILSIEGNVLRVHGLDALNNTPILDIKLEE